jgi:hypothetical protein
MPGLDCFRASRGPCGAASPFFVGEHGPWDAKAPAPGSGPELEPGRVHALSTGVEEGDLADHYKMHGALRLLEL